MTKSLRILSLLVPIFLFVLVAFQFSLSKDLNERNKPHTSRGNPDETILNINNISSWVRSNGMFPYDAFGNNSNGFYPRGKVGAIFTEGILWGGKVKDGISPELRVNGNTYESGLVPGAISGISTGTVEDPNSDDVRIWRVRINWETVDLSKEVQDYRWNKIESEIRQQYQKDWNEWPADKGAPFQDINGNNQYDPESDIPGIPGADQTIWFVSNDINGQHIYESPPIGIELQMTLWSYDRPQNDPFADMQFRRARLIYKGTASTPANSIIKEMFISQWVDPDVGDGSDDYVGCDSLYSLCYAYNSSNIDNNYYDQNLFPPAIGYQLIHGPMVTSPGDTGYFNFKQWPGFKNLSMTSFLWFGTFAQDSDPDLNDYDGTLQWYNLMLGLRPRPEYPNGEPWIDPLTDQPTVYPLSGDPVAGTGWVDGITLYPGDRRMGFSTGPFTMALGDTQEVTIATIGEISSKSDLAYLNNTQGLKRKANNIRTIFIDKIAAHVDAPTIVKINEEVSAKGSYLIVDPNLSMSNTNWSFISKPQGSNSEISHISPDSVTFIPDIEGNYILEFMVRLNSGNSANARIDIFASSNQAPVPSFTIIPDTIIVGDSVLVDASATYDPEGDNIEYNWKIYEPRPGQDFSRTFFNTFSEGKKAYLTPTQSGEFEVKLTASDGTFENDATGSFHVKPKLDNITLEYAFIDTIWFRTISYYFHGDKVFIPIQPMDYVRMYSLHSDRLSYYKDLNMPNTVKVFKIQDNLIFTGTQGNLLGFWGPGALDIYEIGADWEITPVLQDYLPGAKDLYSIFVEGDTVVARDYDTVYIIDISQAASPQIVRNRSYSSEKQIVSNPEIVGDYLFIGIREWASGTRKIEVLDKSSLELESDIYLPEGWRSFNLADSLMFVGYKDSLQIYNLGNTLQPARLSSIVPSPPFDFLEDYYIKYSGNYIENNLLAVRSGYGLEFYDIADPGQPILKSTWIDLHGYQSVYVHEGEYYITGTDVTGNIKSKYYGINKVSLDFQTAIDNKYDRAFPQNHTLFQNYPNPFNPETKIKFGLPKAGRVKLEVFNILGQRVAVLLDGHKPAGYHEVTFDGSKLASGVYYYRIWVSNPSDQAKNFVQVKKMLLVK